MKRIFSLFLIVSLAVCLISGCNSDATIGVVSGSDVDPTPTQPIDIPEPSAPEDSDSEEAVTLEILLEQDDAMINNYSLIAVDPYAPFVDASGEPIGDVYVNTDGAAALISWLLSDAGRDAVVGYGAEDYGEQLFYWRDDAPVCTDAPMTAGEANEIIRLSTTTSVNDSGLLQYVLPQFEAATGYKVEVTSAGTGKAIANAKMGNADLILVHSKSQEEAFVSEGFGGLLDGMESERLTFMYNYFVLCGPSNDPADVKGASDVYDAFSRIAQGSYTFISRGDSSGTHTKEISLWSADLGITADAESVANYSWYNFSNAGMGVCLTMANEMNGYILSDKATFLTFRANGGIID